MTPTGDPARWSRYAGTVMTWDWMLPAARHDEALADRLVEFARLQPGPPVLTYCSDQSMVFVSQHRERLAEGFRFVVPDPEPVAATWRCRAGPARDHPTGPVRSRRPCARECALISDIHANLFALRAAVWVSFRRAIGPTDPGVVRTGSGHYPTGT